MNKSETDAIDCAVALVRAKAAHSKAAQGFDAAVIALEQTPDDSNVQLAYLDAAKAEIAAAKNVDECRHHYMKAHKALGELSE